jgi:hypothetical protein
MHSHAITCTRTHSHAITCNRPTLASSLREPIANGMTTSSSLLGYLVRLAIRGSQRHSGYRMRDAITDQSKCNWFAITVPSEAPPKALEGLLAHEQPAINGQSTGNQRAINGQSTGNQRVISGR